MVAKGNCPSLVSLTCCKRFLFAFRLFWKRWFPSLSMSMAFSGVRVACVSLVCTFIVFMRRWDRCWILGLSFNCGHGPYPNPLFSGIGTHFLELAFPIIPAAGSGSVWECPDRAINWTMPLGHQNKIKYSFHPRTF